MKGNPNPRGKDDKSNDKKTTTINKRMFLHFYKENTCNISKGAELTHIHRVTVYDWRESDPKFAQDMDEIYESLIDEAEVQLTNNIRQGKETSLIFYLANKGKPRGWQSINKVEVNGNLKVEPIAIIPATPEADKGIKK